MYNLSLENFFLKEEDKISNTSAVKICPTFSLCIFLHIYNDVVNRSSIEHQFLHCYYSNFSVCPELLYE